MWELGVALEAMLSARCLKIRTQECGYIECIKCTTWFKTFVGLVALNQAQSPTIALSGQRVSSPLFMKIILELVVAPNLFCLALQSSADSHVGSVAQQAGRSEKHHSSSTSKHNNCK